MAAERYTSASTDEETIGLFDVLANKRRQYIVYRLAKAEEPIALADLAYDIAAMETDEMESASHEDAEQTLTQLYHNHVPKLCDHNVASFNQCQRTISSAANTERAQRILTAATV